MYFGASACAMKAFVCICDGVHLMLVCALVIRLCMYADANVVCVCTWWGLCVWWGSFFLAIHRQFVRPAVEARPKPVEQLEPLHD